MIQLYKPDLHFPIQEKNQCLHDTIKNLYQTIPHNQLNFEIERKILISLGGFPEFLSEKREEEKSLKKLIDKIKEEFELNKIPQEKEINDLLKNKALQVTEEDNHKLQEIRERWSYIQRTVRKVNSFEKEIRLKKEVHFYEKAQQTLRSDAVERAIYKDIPQSYRIDSPLNLERFLYVLAGQVTGLLSLKEISKDISQVSVQTLDRYLKLLNSNLSGILQFQNYDNNERNVQRRQRKAYFVDIAVRNAALQKDHISQDSSEIGKFYEKFRQPLIYII